MTGGTCGENLTWKLNYNGTLTISGTGAIEDYPVGKEAPWGNRRNQIENIIIKVGVTKIGDWAFMGCENLIAVDIPASVTAIGKNVFSYCNKLERIYYPEGRGLNFTLSRFRKGNSAQLIPYKNTSSPAQVKSTPQPVNQLHWKVEGKTLTVGGVREIKFYSYGDLPWVRSVDAIQEIVIEAGVEKISPNTFSECTRLELLTIPASVKTIGDYAFTFCYCGNRAVNGGKNVIWSLADGVLTFKKNPAAKFATDFSIGAVSWCAVEKNITGFKLEAGVVPKEKFFEWLAQRDNAAQISFA